MTPSLTFKDSKKAIDFYKKAFNATLLDVFPGMDGKGVMHASVKIGDSIIMMGDEMPPMAKSAESFGGSPISFFIYVPDADAAFKQAVNAGATVMMPVAEMFWGDRAGNVKDPFGYQWMLATHKRDMTQDQIRAEARTFFSSAGRK
ncbi:MAG TPA: VOC family protein [Elusimicrobiota bacterium]|nr:VOC family protein [Elusimicrobiota bacterium]